MMGEKEISIIFAESDNCNTTEKRVITLTPDFNNTKVHNGNQNNCCCP